MLTTLEATTPVEPARALRGIPARVAGLGALGFAGIVLLQNIVRGTSTPSNAASGEEVLAHFADHRALTFVLVASFAVCAIALATFVAGTMRHLLASHRPEWAIAGGIGATVVMCLFSIVVASETTLSVLATGDSPDVGAIEAVWAFHHSAFSFVELFLAITLVGLARAGVAAGLTPKIFDRLAPVAGVLLVIGAAAGPAVAAGQAMPLFGLAGLGFLTWLAFLTTTGLRLVRS